MNILLSIHHHLDKNSGAPGVTMHLGDNYVSMGHSVTYFSYDDLPSWLRRLKKPLFPFWLAKFVLSRCDSEHFDVVDSSTADAWVLQIFRFLHKRRISLLVTRSHGLEHLAHLAKLESASNNELSLSWKYPVYNGGLHLWEVGQSLKRSDINFFLNNDDLEFSVKKIGVDSEKNYIVPNGIPDYLLGLKIENGAPFDGRIKIAIVGSYIPRKGTKYVSDTIEYLFDKYDNLDALFLGGNVEPEEVYRDFSPSAHSRIKVVSKYQHSHLPALLDGCQIKLFLTLAEGFGLALLEAMACGLAPVVTATSGPKTIISNGYNGLIVKPRDSRSAIEAVESLLNNQKLLEEIRTNAYKTAQDYSWSKISLRQLSLYEAALKERVLSEPS